MAKIKKNGIDVSKHNGVLDWKQLKEFGLEFAIIRAGYGNNNLDSKAIYNIEKALENGFDVGLYWFSYALNKVMANKEGDYICNIADKFKITFPIYYDLEYDSVTYAKKNGIEITRHLYNEFTKSFCDQVEDRGYYAGFYCNRDYLNRYVSRETLKRYDCWLADYNNIDRLDYNMVQISSKGKFPPHSCNFDLDYCYKDYPAIIKKAGLNHLKGD